MARQGKGILDGFSGSVANITGSKVKNKNIIKLKQENENPTVSIIQSDTRYSMKLAHDVFNEIKKKQIFPFVKTPNQARTIFNQFASFFISLYNADPREIILGQPFSSKYNQEKGRLVIFDHGFAIGNTLFFDNKQLPRGASTDDKLFRVIVRIFSTTSIQVTDLYNQNRSTGNIQFGTTVGKNEVGILLMFGLFYNKFTGYMGNAIAMKNTQPWS